MGEQRGTAAFTLQALLDVVKTNQTMIRLLTEIRDLLDQAEDEDEEQPAPAARPTAAPNAPHAAPAAAPATPPADTASPAWMGAMEDLITEELGFDPKTVGPEGMSKEMMKAAIRKLKEKDAPPAPTNTGG